MKKESKPTKYLPDTNVLILAAKDGGGHEARAMDSLIVSDQLVFSPIVIAEYLVNATEKEKTYLAPLLDEFPIIPIMREAAEIAANYRRKYKRKTHATYLLDCLIAATCKQHGFALVTNNTADFPMEDIPILAPEELQHDI